MSGHRMSIFGAFCVVFGLACPFLAMHLDAWGDVYLAMIGTLVAFGLYSRRGG